MYGVRSEAIEWRGKQELFPLLAALPGTSLVIQVIKNLPSNVGDGGLIPGGGTKIAHAAGQLSLHTTMREARVPQ